MSTTTWCGLILPSVPPASMASTTTTSAYSQTRLDAHTTNQRNQQTHHAWWRTAPCVVGVWSWIRFIFDVNGICELSTDSGNCCSQTVGTKCDASGLDFGYGTRAGGRGRASGAAIASGGAAWRVTWARWVSAITTMGPLFAPCSASAYCCRVVGWWCMR